MRVIHSKRETATGELFHWCPYKSRQIESDGCDDCSYFGGLDTKEATYDVLCQYTDANQVALVDFDPPKAHDTVGSLVGVDVIHSRRHTWVEPKLDGVRALVHVTPSGVFITSRRRDKYGNFRQFQDNVPHIRDNPFWQKFEGYMILDGEIIVPKDNDHLGATMSVVGSLPDNAIAAQRELGLAQLHLFDIVRWYDTNIDNAALTDRSEALDQVLESKPDYIHRVPHQMLEAPEDKFQALNWAWDQGYEGLVLKDPGSLYKGTRAWLKVKQSVTMDCQIVGWIPGKVGTKYEETLGSLEIAVIDAQSMSLHAVANVMPGDDAIRDHLYARLSPLNTQQILDLKLIVEVKAQLITKDFSLRHPRIIRFRPDRSEPNVIYFDALKRP